MGKIIKLKMPASYDGSSVKNNGAVELKFKISSVELSQAMKFLLLLNQNIKLRAKTPEDKFTLGMFLIKEFKVDGDGEIRLKFDSEVDFAETNNFDKLINQSSLVVLFKAEVEEEDGESLEDAN